MRRAGRGWLLGLSLGAMACAGVAPWLAGKSDRIRVPHERHAKADVDCSTCHESLYESEALGSPAFPKEKTCLSCHREEKTKGNCGFCHERADKPASFSRAQPTLTFNHVKHLERTNEECGVCHKTLPAPFAAPGNTPPMSACTSCHEHKEQYESGVCNNCHTDLTKYALRPVSDFSHRADYVKQHRLEARSTQQCAQCHEQTFCSDCHSQTQGRRVELRLPERTDRQFIHRLDFFGRHSVEARAQELMCNRCHGTSFCADCHAQNRLVPSASSVNPHPAGFNDRASSTFHGRAARREINTCAACHDQGAASNCVTCHRAGGIGGNPHPASWSARHGREEIRSNAMCQICHL